MEPDHLLLRSREWRPNIAAWKWLLWAALSIFFFNAMVAVWWPWPVESALHKGPPGNATAAAANEPPKSGFNGWESIWTPKPQLLNYEVPSRDVLEAGRLWAVFTYALVVTHWFWGPISLVFLWVFGQMVEADLSRREMFILCGLCALAGAAAWLPLHWAQSDSLESGGLVLAIGLVTYWCLTAPDEPMAARLLFIGPLRPKVFLVVLLALEMAALLIFELPQVMAQRNTGGEPMFATGIYNSSHLGAMLAAWLCSRWFRPGRVAAAWPEFPAEAAARKRVPTAMQVGAGRANGAAEEAAAPPRAVKVDFANRREVREEVDRILDKINDGGIGSLRPEEREVLDKAKDLLGK